VFTLKSVHFFHVFHIFKYIYIIQKNIEYGPVTINEFTFFFLFSMLLVQYQHRLGRKCCLAAVIACSASWDPHVTSRALETKFFNNLFYSRTLANDLKDLFKRSETFLIDVLYR